MTSSPNALSPTTVDSLNAQRLWGLTTAKRLNESTRSSNGLGFFVMLSGTAQNMLRQEGAEISFSPEDVKRRRKELNLKDLEAKNASLETSKAKSQAGADLLSAMLERYKPENFLTYYIPGKPEPAKDKPDMFTLNVEISFNTNFYKESFLPDLEQVLDQIAAVKKNGLLIKYKNQLRNIAANKPVSTQDTVILQVNGLGGEYSIAVYDKSERFGVRLYGFRNEDKAKIANALSEFRRQEAMVAGILIEL